MCNSGFTHVTSENGGKCTGCIAGKYKTLKGNSLCTDCLSGQYSTEENSTTDQCMNCPQDSTSFAGSQTPTSCVCNMGFSVVDGGVCTTCDIGKFSQRGPRVFEGYQFLCTGSINWAHDHFAALVETQGSCTDYCRGQGSFCLTASDNINNFRLPDMSYSGGQFIPGTESFCDSILTNQICLCDITPNSAECKDCPANKTS